MPNQLTTMLIAAGGTTEQPSPGPTDPEFGSYGVFIQSSGVNVSSAWRLADQTLGRAQSQTDMYVFNSGVITGGTIDGLNGNQYMNVYISSGGAVSAAGGSGYTSYNVYSGGSLCMMTFPDPSYNFSCYDGGKVTNVTLNQYANCRMFGGRVEGLTMKANAWFGMVLNSGSQGATMNDIFIDNASGGGKATLIIRSNTVATTVYGSGAAIVVSSGGSLCHGSLGNATLTLSGGFVQGLMGYSYVSTSVLNDGVITNAIYESKGCHMKVSSGGRCSVCGFTTSGASASIYSGGSAVSCYTSSRGDILVSPGGQASNCSAVAGGFHTVLSGGISYDLILSSGGALYVSNGGSAVRVTKQQGANVYVATGGYVDYA